MAGRKGPRAPDWEVAIDSTGTSLNTNRPSPNPKRVAAGRLNCRKRRGLSPEGRERLRQAALANKPWQQATGPRTVEGKKRAALNGRAHQKGESSARELRRLLAGLTGLAGDMAVARRLAAEQRGGRD